MGRVDEWTKAEWAGHKAWLKAIWWLRAWVEMTQLRSQLGTQFGGLGRKVLLASTSQPLPGDHPDKNPQLAAESIFSNTHRPRK